MIQLDENIIADATDTCGEIFCEDGTTFTKEELEYMIETMTNLIDKWRDKYKCLSEGVME